MAKKYVEMGVKYITYSVDVGIFSQACSSITNKLSTPGHSLEELNPTY